MDVAIGDLKNVPLPELQWHHMRRNGRRQWKTRGHLLHGLAAFLLHVKKIFFRQMLPCLWLALLRPCAVAPVQRVSPRHSRVLIGRKKGWMVSNPLNSPLLLSPPCLLSSGGASLLFVLGGACLWICAFSGRGWVLTVFYRSYRTGAVETLSWELESFVLIRRVSVIIVHWEKSLAI